MRIWITLLLAFVLCGCHSGVRTVSVALPGRVNPQYLIYVGNISTDSPSVEERAVIEARYATILKEALEKWGYRAQLASSGPARGPALTLSGEVTHYNPAKRKRTRDPVSEGPGSTRLYTSFTLENPSDYSTVAQFVVLSIGKANDLRTVEQYLTIHMKEAAGKAAAYLAGKRR